MWKRLADRSATVVADTPMLMLTLSPEYAAHFHDIYIDAKHIQSKYMYMLSSYM